MAEMGARALVTLQQQTARVESKIGLNQSNSRWNILFTIYFKLWLEKKKSNIRISMLYQNLQSSSHEKLPDWMTAN